MILAHRIALDATNKQQRYFARAAGCDRFVWNLALEMWNTEYLSYGKVKASELKKRFNAVKYAQYPWMLNIHRDAHADPFDRLQQAWSKHFKSPKQTARPKFHKKGRKDSFYISNDRLTVAGFKARLPVVGWIQTREELRFSGKIMGAVVTRKANRWFVSIRVELPDKEAQRRPAILREVVGVDLGLKSAVTLSTGEKIEAPKPLKISLRKMRRIQRAISRRKRGSSNRNKLVLRMARVHCNISNVRSDFWHKITTRLCRENQTIGIEDLNVSGMLKNRRLSRSVSDAGFHEFRRQLEYKAKIYGTKVVVADRWFPSSKTCSECGYVKEVLTLSERVFHCDCCGCSLDRDVNAAVNLEQHAKHLLPTACGEITLGDSMARKATG